MNPDIFNVLDGVKVLRESEVRQIVREEILRHMARDLPSAIDDAVESGMTKGIMKILWASGILIDIDALRRLISNQGKMSQEEREVEADPPTIDPEEIVRCRECKHFASCEEVLGVPGTGFCKDGQFRADEDDFCSRGERRSNV